MATKQDVLTQVMIKILSRLLLIWLLIWLQLSDVIDFPYKEQISLNISEKNKLNNYLATYVITIVNTKNLQSHS